MVRGPRVSCYLCILEVGAVGTQPLTCPQHPGFRGSPHAHLEDLPPGPGLPHLLASAPSLVLGPRVFQAPSAMLRELWLTPACSRLCLLKAPPPPPRYCCPSAPHLPGMHPRPSLLSTAPVQGLPWLCLIWRWRGGLGPALQELMV